MRVETRRHWIPPGGLVAGFLAHGLSWALLLGIAARGALAADLPALAWVHLVGLGWLTMIALSVLVHVVPSFTDVAWKGEGIARGSLVVYGAGVAALVAAFWTASVWALPWAGMVVGLGLLAYLGPATWTLLAALRGERVEAAIARALLLTLASLLVTAALGVALAWALAGRLPGGIIGAGPPAHAAFGIVGWLTVLVMGVSTRTLRPISGARTRFAWVHIAVGSAQLAALAALAGGFAFAAPPLVWTGAVLVSLGALFYAGDVADVLRRATVPHRPPQAFAGIAVLWLLVGLGLADATLANAPTGAAAIYVLLVGWTGQMVNAHLYHIGIRLIATMARGDDDETRPGELLAAPLSWSSFALFQAAVAAGAIALLAGDARTMGAAALSGLAGWVTMAVNVATARRRA